MLITAIIDVYVYIIPNADVGANGGAAPQSCDNDMEGNFHVDVGVSHSLPAVGLRHGDARHNALYQSP